MIEKTKKSKTTENTEFTWQDEWKEMPEFVQEKKEPFSKITVRFETQDDLESFAELIGQKLTPKTKSIWHPFKSHWGEKRHIYGDE